MENNRAALAKAKGKELRLPSNDEERATWALRLKGDTHKGAHTQEGLAELFELRGCECYTAATAQKMPQFLSNCVG